MDQETLMEIYLAVFAASGNRMLVLLGQILTRYIFAHHRPVLGSDIAESIVTATTSASRGDLSNALRMLSKHLNLVRFIDSMDSSRKARLNRATRPEARAGKLALKAGAKPT
jgi:hypothetical protein